MSEMKEIMRDMKMEWDESEIRRLEDERSEEESYDSPPLIYMNRTEGNDGMEKMLAEELKLWVAGQKEYARSPNIFANFTRLGESLKLPPEKILMVYATKHMDGIMSWINGHKSQREDVRGRINDLRVYLAILYLMVEAYENKE